MKRAVLTVLIAAAALACGIGLYQWRQGEAPPEAAATLWTQSLKDPASGEAQTLAPWRGKVLIVNFWATWCEPCREEIPLFVRLQREYGERGLQFVGIAIDDPAKIAPFAKEFGINYPLLVGGMDAADWSRQLGNRAGGLPFTLIVGRDGEVRASHLGAIKESALLPFIQTLL